MTFEEALNYFTNRRIVSPQEFALLADDLKRYAFTATRLATEAMRNRAFRLVESALRRGTDFSAFRSGITEANFGNHSSVISVP